MPSEFRRAHPATTRLADSSLFVLTNPSRRPNGESHSKGALAWSTISSCAPPRAIYDAVYPGEEWAPVGFDQAERLRTVHYRQAVDAARQARSLLGERLVQPELFALPPSLPPARARG